MSPRASDFSKPSAGPFRKPRADVYTMMLLVALLALLIGTVFLYLEVRALEVQAYAPQPFGDASPTGGTTGGTAIGFGRSAVGFWIADC